jgi:integrase
MVFNEASKSPGSAAARDAAMVHLVFRIGLRGIETRRLTWGDITTDRGVSVVRLFGKGRKAATLTLPDDVVAVLASWRSQLEAAAGRTVRHDDAMFPSIGRGSSIIKSAVAKDSALKPISPGRLIQIFKTTLERAGVGGYRRATHTGRATAASIAYEQTGDILGVQKMLRHANLEQSAKYIRRENDCRAMTSSWTPAISSPGFPHGRS